MNLIDKYTKPVGAHCHDSATSKLSLGRLARQAARQGQLFTVCAWCHPPSLNPELARMDNISHGICKPCGEAQLKGLR